ncbi:MAG: phosphatidate cytidylyltransferase [Elusimicrobiota bacterium]|jgi:phosphatidate cytidylyltransferase|nr:phosphatidate cytidylyltransferase [Elusimicrobiota bacterium]
MLKTRILAALVGIPIIFICIFVGGWLFLAFIFIVNVFCIHEYLTLCNKYHPHKAVSIGLEIVFFIVLFLMYKYNPSLILVDEYNSAFLILMAAVIAILLVLFALEVYYQQIEASVARIAVSFLGIIFLPIPFIFMILIGGFFKGPQYLFLFFVTVWTLDTVAYGIGKKYGKRQLSLISPKKTVEGAVGGLVGGILTAIIISAVLSLFPVWKAALLGLVIAVIGQFSDIAESVIKRDANIKDSGSIIPGHGGVLDRFDSYLFAAPAVYFLILLLQGSNY